MTKRAEGLGEGKVGGAERILNELSAVTASVCEAVANDRFEQAAELLAERGRLLEALSSLQNGSGSGDPRALLPGPLREMDEQLIFALNAKRKTILEKLLEIRKREAAKAYTL